MFEEILRDVERLRDEWASRPPLPEESELAGLELPPPRRAEGADSSGTVHVAIDADGLPESITVDPGWRRGVGSERFGDAVVEACENAATAQLSARFTDPATTEPAARVPEPVPRSYSIDPSRDLVDQIRENTRADIPFEMATGTGTAAFGKVVVTLSQAGLRSFTAEPEWLARQKDGELAEALATALASAHAELAEARADRARGRSDR